MKVHVQGAGVHAPGLQGYPALLEILVGSKPYTGAPALPPSPEILPPVERRRSAETVRYALSVAHEALAMSGMDAKEVASVFASAGGDGATLHQICAALAAADHTVSPTRFHNSVHNAAAGYWSIAAGSPAPSTSLCAHDASFAAGLLDAAAQVTVDRCAVLLVAFDCPEPEPLRALNTVRDPCAVAFVLSPRHDERTIASWQISIQQGDGAEPTNFPGDKLQNPAASALPLLASLAKKEAALFKLRYFSGQRVLVECQS
jgi:hypothetical protein